MIEVIALAETGKVHAEIERYSLDEVSEVYEKLQKNEITGRAVFALPQ